MEATGAREVVEVGEGTGSGMMTGETGSMGATVEMLGSAADAEVETAVGIEELEEEAVATTDCVETGTD